MALALCACKKEAPDRSKLNPWLTGDSVRKEPLPMYRDGTVRRDSATVGQAKTGKKTPRTAVPIGATDVDEDLTGDPEYRKGGKYDPEKYHTDYTKDEDGERRRREYIDANGYDDIDDYDEFYGYGWRQRK